MKKLFWTGAGVLAPFSLWTLAHLHWGGVLVPAPWFTALQAVLSFTDPGLWKDLLLTFVRAAAGFFLALGAGLFFGLKAGKPGAPHGGITFSMTIIQAAPALLWSIPFLLVFGTGGGAPAAVSFIVSLPMVYFLAQASRQAISPALQDVFRIYAPSRRMRFHEMLRPALSASLRPAVLVGFALSVKSAVVGEWFGARDGFGRRIQTAHAMFDLARFYSDTLVFILFILFLGWLTRLLAKSWFPERVPAALPQDNGYVCREAESVPPSAGVSLKVEKLGFSYGPKKIFSDLDLYLPPGKTLLVTGNSGSGKTTLAKVLVGLLKPSAGKCTLSGRAALVFQDDGLLEHRDALGNAALALWERRDPEWRPKALLALELAGLCEPGIFPFQMSGGMRKRLALARALASDAELLILDEPFVNLHPEARSELWDCVFGLQRARGLGLIVISHYPEEVRHRVDAHLRMGG